MKTEWSNFPDSLQRFLIVMVLAILTVLSVMVWPLLLLGAYVLVASSFGFGVLLLVATVVAIWTTWLALVRPRWWLTGGYVLLVAIPAGYCFWLKPAMDLHEFSENRGIYSGNEIIFYRQAWGKDPLKFAAIQQNKERAPTLKKFRDVPQDVMAAVRGVAGQLDVPESMRPNFKKDTISYTENIRRNSGYGKWTSLTIYDAESRMRWIIDFPEGD